jgi:hypothetical protein
MYAPGGGGGKTRGGEDIMMDYLQGRWMASWLETLLSVRQITRFINTETREAVRY